MNSRQDQSVIDIPAKSIQVPAAVHKQIRGSGLLLAGKVLSTALVFVAQVLIVRQLPTGDYGAFSYALAIVTSVQAFSTLGMTKAIPRFVPIYQERSERAKIAGTVVLAVALIVATLVVMIATLVLVPAQLLESIVHGHRALTVVSVLMFLVPVEALNDVLISLFASFGRPREIFVRSHVVGPVLRLLAVLALVALHAGVMFLALGYLVSSLLGVLIYAVVLARYMFVRGLLEGVSLCKIQVPIREMLSFAIPILSSELVTGVMMNAIAVLILGYLHGMDQVAMFRVAVPAARLNLTVMASFSLLFTPAAARLFAKADYDGINHLYWRTTAWIAVLTLPVFVVTFSLSRPLTLLLYGDRYGHSANVLAMLALAYYFNVALGFNTLTLRVFGKLRAIIIVNVVAAAANIGLSVVLIPRYGAMGAATAVTFSMIFLNLITQLALRSAPGFRVFDKQYASVYIFVAAGALGLFAFQIYATPNRMVAGALAAGLCIVVFACCKRNLNMAESFPEVRKVPLLRAIFG